MDPRELKAWYQRLLDDYHSGAIDWQTFEQGLFELKRIRAALLAHEDTDSSIIPDSGRIERMRRQADKERPNRFAKAGDAVGAESATMHRTDSDVARLKQTEPTATASGSGVRAAPGLPVGEGSGIHGPHSGVLKAVSRRLQVGTLLGERYALQRSLGTGTLGEAWLAKNVKSDNYVVVKLIPFPIQHSSKPLEKFVNLFRRVSALKHPNICPVYFLDEDERFGAFVVSAYLDAVPLDQYYSQYVQTSQTFPMLAVVRVLWPIAMALDHARNHKTFHGLLKPQNIMIGKSCGAMITDLGLAENVRTSLRELGLSTNNGDAASWRAPEVWLNDRNGPLADQFSLAALAYQLVAGTPPFIGRNESELREQIIYARPPQITSESDCINAAFQQALSKDPFNRFPSCLHFVKALIEPTVSEPQSRNLDARSGLFPFLFGIPQPEKPACLASDTLQDLWPAEMDEVKSHDLHIPQHSVYPYPGNAMEAASATPSVFTWLASPTAIILGGVTSCVLATGIFLTSWLVTPDKVVPPPDNSLSTVEDSTVASPPPANQPSVAASENEEDLPPVSEEELLKWQQLASDGDAEAQRKLGECFYHGNGVPANFAKAIRYFRQAAVDDDVMSLYYLGRCYELGLGVPADINAAKKYYDRAKKAGSTEAETALRRINEN